MADLMTEEQVQDHKVFIDEMTTVLGKMALIFGISVLELMITLLVRLVANEPDENDIRP